MASIQPMPVSHDQLQRSDSQASTESTSSTSSSRGRTPQRPQSNDNEPFPPGDARGMSPRRSGQECGELEKATRLAMKAHAEQMQKALSDIAESIKLVREDYEKLEKGNLALQDYIGNLTRTVGRETPGSRKNYGKKTKA